MPRWKGLPEELDPRLGEFVGRLRRLVDRSGLSVAAVAERTGYSRTSWDRYLHGRLLAPKGAVVALAEITGTDPEDLTTLWESAERAWSRSETRQDMTREALRIARARDALADPAPAPSAAVRPRVAGGAAGVGPTPSPSSMPTRPEASGLGVRVDGVPGDAAPPGAQDRPRPGARRRRPVLLLTAVAGTLALVLGAVWLTSDGGRRPEARPRARTPAAAASTVPTLPAGVRCAGDACVGKDPERMGCGGARARTTTSVTVGTTLVEVRYSEVCGAAWGRITRAARGDRVTVRVVAPDGATAEGRVQRGTVGDEPGGAADEADGADPADTDAYTPMVRVGGAGGAEVCAMLASGLDGCAE